MLALVLVLVLFMLWRPKSGLLVTLWGLTVYQVTKNITKYSCVDLVLVKIKVSVRVKCSSDSKVRVDFQEIDVIQYNLWENTVYRDIHSLQHWYCGHSIVFFPTAIYLLWLMLLH